jgi:hypothetical protein
MKNQPNQTNELQINLAKFEEFAEVFINQQDAYCDEYPSSARDSSEQWINAFKEFIFSAELNKQKRKEEYFKLKEQLESMKEEFEPDADRGTNQVVYKDCEGEYTTVPASCGSCTGCAFANKSCAAVINFHSCGEHKIIWIKK